MGSVEGLAWVPVFGDGVISRRSAAATFRAASISRRCASMTMSISSRAANSRRRRRSIHRTAAPTMTSVAMSLGASKLRAKGCASSCFHALRAAMKLVAVKKQSTTNQSVLMRQKTAA